MLFVLNVVLGFLFWQGEDPWGVTALVNVYLGST